MIRFACHTDCSRFHADFTNYCVLQEVTYPALIWLGPHFIPFFPVLQTDPFNRSLLTSDMLVPDVRLKMKIEEFLSSHQS